MVDTVMTIVHGARSFEMARSIGDAVKTSLLSSGKAGAYVFSEAASKSVGASDADTPRDMEASWKPQTHRSRPHSRPPRRRTRQVAARSVVIVQQPPAYAHLW